MRARDGTRIEAEHGFDDRGLRLRHGHRAGEGVEVAAGGRRRGVLIVVELDAEGLLQLLRGAAQPDAARGAVFMHQRQAVARGERAHLVYRLLRGAVGVQVLLAAELAALQAGEIERLRAFEDHRHCDLLRCGGLADMPAVARRAGDRYREEERDAPDVRGT